MRRPKHSLNLSKIDLIVSMSEEGFAENIRTSSAKSEVRSSCLPMLMPCSGAMWDKYLDRGSKAMLKRSGDRGQPCRVPLWRRNSSERRRAATSLAAGVVYMVFIRWAKGPENPILVMTMESHSKLTLTKAFSTSRVMIAQFPSGLHLACSRAIITFLMFMVAVLPFTNPDWAGCIREGMMSANLVAIILERILTSRFRSDIGLYEPGSCGSLPFLANNLMMAWLPVSR